MKLFSLVCIFVIISSIVVPVSAQGLPEGQRVTIEAADGLELVGLYFTPDVEEPAPAVLLMHHGGGQKESWYDFIEPLNNAGYVALSIDMRGHGESGTHPDWEMGFDDTQRWITWLSEQPQVDADHISIVGASLGGDVGLNVMAADERVRTIVVLSPGLDVDGVTTADAVEATGDRPVFLIAGDGDQAGWEAVTTLLPLMSGDGQVRIYDTTGCCTFFFMLEPDAADSILAWLDTYGR